MINKEGVIKAAILRNELENDHVRWIDACIKFKDQILYLVIDLTRNDWLDKICEFAPDLLLVKPGGLTSSFKQLYDERLMILVEILGYKCFPTLDEVLIYENKRYFSYWLEANEIPHPETHVFYFREEAVGFIKSTGFPLVGKVNIGGSGSGVKILYDKSEAIKYIKNTFSGKGASKRSGPNMQKPGILKRGSHYIFHPGDIVSKLNIYKKKRRDLQNQFVILQKYIPHNYEWRVVRIGDSFFAHKKLKIGDKASGTLLKSYDNPPFAIFDFVKRLTDRFSFFSQAIDLFESENGFLVNEMQCIFGQSDSFQMLVNNKPGRYIYLNNTWSFEEGDFNTNESYDLRVQAALDLFKDNRI